MDVGGYRGSVSEPRRREGQFGDLSYQRWSSRVYTQCSCGTRHFFPSVQSLFSSFTSVLTSFEKNLNLNKVNVLVGSKTTR